MLEALKIILGKMHKNAELSDVLKFFVIANI